MVLLGAPASFTEQGSQLPHNDTLFMKLFWGSEIWGPKSVCVALDTEPRSLNPEFQMPHGVAWKSNRESKHKPAAKQTDGDGQETPKPALSPAQS